MTKTNNIINIFTGKPIKSFRKSRGKTFIPELEVKQEVSAVISFIREYQYELDEIYVFGRKFDGEYIEADEICDDMKARIASRLFHSLQEG